MSEAMEHPCSSQKEWTKSGRYFRGAKGDFAHQHLAGLQSPRVVADNCIFCKMSLERDRQVCGQIYRHVLAAERRPHVAVGVSRRYAFLKTRKAA